MTEEIGRRLGCCIYSIIRMPFILSILLFSMGLIIISPIIALIKPEWVEEQ